MNCKKTLSAGMHYITFKKTGSDFQQLVSASSDCKLGWNHGKNLVVYVFQP